MKRGVLTASFAKATSQRFISNPYDFCSFLHRRRILKKKKPDDHNRQKSLKSDDDEKMAVFSFSVTHTALLCLLALFIILFSNPILILSSGTQDSSSTTNSKPDFFDSQISLYGDAAFVDGGSSIRLTNPSISSIGMVMYQKGLRFDAGGGFVSFSAHFSFSISPDKGDGIVFLIVPSGLVSKFPGKGKFGLSGVDKFLGIEFDTSDDRNRVAINIPNLASSNVANVSDIDLVLNSDKKFQSWIDYDADSKRIEVRLSEFNTARPYDALLSYNLDLGQMWTGEDVYAGIIGSSGNSTQISTVLYSCKFVVKDTKSSMHSQPLDPFSLNRKNDEGNEEKSKFCPLSILAGLIFTTGCGALMAFVILFLWVVFIDRHRIQAEPEFKYENINVVVENDKDDVKK